MPAFLLKRQILINLPSDNLERDVANSIDFMVERVWPLYLVCNYYYYYFNSWISWIEVNLHLD